MPKACDHNIPETRKGVGSCEISFEVKKRNGQPNWWCRTHGMEAGAPDGNPLPSCSAAWFEAVPPERQISLDLAEGEVSVWGAVPPAIQIGEYQPDVGKVHVHRRPRGSNEKDIDTSFDIVRLRLGSRELVVENMGAVAFSISELAGQQVVALRCPKATCGGMHIDEQKFATHPHVKHLCNSCGRNFRDARGPSISNHLADAYAILDLPRHLSPMRANRVLDLNRANYSVIALWPSNAAIITTATRPEEIGIHVHAWDLAGQQIVDETYSSVSLDGETLDERLVRALSVQRAVSHDSPVISISCAGCGAALLSPTTGWIEPVTTHHCECGATTTTRRRVFANPLADK
jgi:hypothetical protein